MDNDTLEVSVSVSKNGVASFPSDVKTNGNCTFITKMDPFDLPDHLVKCYSNSRCGRKFKVGRKVTKLATIEVRNCEFPCIQGPYDGTILDIDESSKNFALQRGGISGFFNK